MGGHLGLLTAPSGTYCSTQPVHSHHPLSARGASQQWGSQPTMRVGIARALVLLGVPCNEALDAVRELQLARFAILAEKQGVRIAPSAGKGLGVFATTRLTAASTVGDYAGEQITQRDVDVRYGQPPRSHTLWSASDESWYSRRKSLGIECTGDYIFKVGDDT